MKLKNIKFTIVLCILISSVSCNIDDIEPINQLTEENVIHNEKSAEAMLNASYIKFREFFFSNFYAGLMGAGGEQTIGNFYGSQGFNQNTIQDDNILLADNYKNLYIAINNANFAIDGLEKGKATDIGEVRTNELIAEAKTIRAFSHFLLLRQFGQFFDLNSTYGIVLRMEPARKFEGLPRNSVQECYTAILDDLKFASQNGSTGVAHYYFSAVAAKALLSKVYLYTGDFTNAASTALEVINNTDGYNLASEYGSIFTSNFGEEILFSVYGNSQEGERTNADISFGRYQITPSPYFRALADEQDGVPGDGDPTYNSAGYDARFLYAYDAFSTAGPHSNGKIPFASNSTEDVNTIIYLRLAEFYLVYAEAEARRAGGDLDDALAKLNSIRERVGMPLKSFSTKQMLLQNIREEKMLELFSETGETWFDLIRYDRLGDIDASTIKSTLNSVDQYVLPMPRTALAGNENLIQNPGY